VSLTVNVALSQDFLKSLSKLPNQVQSRVLKWALRFQADPTSTGINYEKINAARDPNLRSVRIDQDWRGIVFKPAVGNLYVLLYVDHHDDAYRWAESRKMAVNPVTGAMQIVCMETITETETRAAEPDAPALFTAYADQELMSIGCPEDLLPQIRRLHSEEDLDKYQDSLPVEAYEGLFLLAAGDSVSQILMSRETRVDQKIDTSDFLEALQRAESQSRFVMIDTEEAMTAVLNAPLSQWRIFLHPTQRKLSMGDRSGPMRILGGAGTGKTVLAMHRVKWLADHATPEGQKVLFTTFTRNLATDIENNLKALCPPATMARIEIKNLDAWVTGYLRSNRFEHRIVYDRSRDGAKDAWATALAIRPDDLKLDEAFYEKELEDVVLAQGIMTLDEYRSARRTGRGVLLSRAKRDAIWPVFEEYRAQLSSRQLKEVDDAYREAALLLRQSPKPLYSAIVIDETQDFGPQALRLIRAMIPEEQKNDLFFVGDGHQRIYNRNRAAMSKCGINIRGRSRKLYLNYRTTEEIRRQAVALLEDCEIDDLDDGQDNNSRYKSISHGPAPVIRKVESLEQAMANAVEVVKAWQGEGQDGVPLTTCVMASTRNMRDNLAHHFNRAGLKTRVLDSNDVDAEEAHVIRLCTMHRAKGLEFDNVLVFQDKDMGEDGGIDPKLLYVALTRAKRRAAMLLLQ
jgi:superfamily I DNA/RNA helicase